MKPDIHLYNPTLDGYEEITNSPFPTDFDISYLLPSSFLKEEFWLDLLVATSAVADTYVNQPIEGILNIRIPESQDRVFKALHAQMMGVAIPDALLTNDGYDRLNNSAGTYLYDQGSDDFICYFGYALGYKLGINKLWTEDYINFQLRPTGPTVFEGGTWYPTTHVCLIYDSNDNVQSNPITEADLTNIFYEYGPLDLVLHWIAVNTTIMLGTLFVRTMMATIHRERFYVDVRGNLQLEIRLQTSIVSSISTTSSVIVPFVLNDFYINTAQAQKQWEIDLMPSGITLWDTSRPLPTTDVFKVRRSTPAWRFTGILEGVWEDANTVRLNHDLVTGNPIGILLEPTRNNFVRESTNIGKAPWTAGAGATSSILANRGLDGTDITLWNGSANVTQQIYLTPGTYSLQVVTLLLGAPFWPAPYIELLGEPVVTYTGAAWPAQEVDITYPVLQTITSTTTEITTTADGLWVMSRVTFTLTESYLINLQLPISNWGTPATAFWYAGIENGSDFTSFIQTGDCDIGLREEDIAYLELTPKNIGTVAVSSVLKDFMDSVDMSFQSQGTELIAFDSLGNQRAILTTGATATANVSVTITDYPPNNLPSIVIQHPTGSDPVANSENPLAYLTWGATGGNFGANGATYSYTSETMNVSQARVGPGWYGHLNVLLIMPYQLTPTQVTLMTNATLLALL